jgi:hypothetical protein
MQWMMGAMKALMSKDSIQKMTWTSYGNTLDQYLGKDVPKEYGGNGPALEGSAWTVKFDDATTAEKVEPTKTAEAVAQPQSSTTPAPTAPVAGEPQSSTVAASQPSETEVPSAPEVTKPWLSKEDQPFAWSSLLGAYFAFLRNTQPYFSTHWNCKQRSG